jgi:Mycothiol maleylpyruvate isomerase N-terminal domain
VGRLAAGWTAIEASYAGLSDARLTEPGVTGDWSVKDILAHVTTWEKEALRHLPVIAAGGRPPRYVGYGGIDAFNAMMTNVSRGRSLAAVLRRLDDTHRRLVRFVRRAPAAPDAREARFRRRLRLDTYGHYPEHVEAIRRWRRRIGE